MRSRRVLALRALLAVTLIWFAAGLAVPASQAASAAALGTASISSGSESSCDLKAGQAYCWGNNGDGQLGDGSSANSSFPVPVDVSGVLAGKTLTRISAGGDHTCALDSTGAAYCWGSNDDGQLGDGSSTSSGVPVAVYAGGALAGTTLTQLVSDASGACALDSTGAAYCWGNYNGDSNAMVPERVGTAGILAGKTLVQITIGNNGTSAHICVLDTAGAAFCWGDNEFGDLGDGSTSSSDTPVAVDTSGVLAGKKLTQISAGAWHTCALDSTGAAYCWGDNGFGELGDGGSASSAVPVAVDISGVLAGKTLTQIAAATEGVNTCALDSAGAAYCWGVNNQGEAGDGNTDYYSYVPAAVDTSGVLAGRTLTQVSIGYDHPCAVDTLGVAYCWGDNESGDLGNDSTAQFSDVPVIAGPRPPTGVIAVPRASSTAVTWTSPVSLDGGTLTGYTATASPGGQDCSTSGLTACLITGLADGTTYSITVVTDTTAGDSGPSAPATVTPGNAVAFTSPASATVAFGSHFSFTVSATGSPEPKITKAGQLPSGITFTAHSNGTATIAGTPSKGAAGLYKLTLTAENKPGSATQVFTLTTTRPPTISKISATTGTIGTAYHLDITTRGYPTPALGESGSLPAGLTFTDNGNGTATVTGTPAPGTSGSHTITVTATNTYGRVSQAFTFTIDLPPAITSTDSAAAVAGAPFTFQITTTGFPAPTITESGHLPRGLTFNRTTATLTGIPSPGTAGTYQITLTAKNKAGTTSQTFTLIII